MAKSNRNKTLSLTIDETQRYLNHCVSSAYFTDNVSEAKSSNYDKIITGSGCENLVVCDDTFKVAPLLPEGFVDLMIVDPPYNLTKNFGKNDFVRMSDEQYRAYTEKWVLAFKPKLKINASVYVCCDWRSGVVIAPVLEKHFIVRNRITWQREKGRGASENWKNGMEDIWFCTVGDDFTFNVSAVKQRKKVLAPYRENGQPKDWFTIDGKKYRDTFPSNFWDDITIPYWSMSENTAHPTQKPEKLIAKLILASSNAGGMVFDPFGGSGSTAVTAKKLDRKFLTVEYNPEFCAWCIARLEKAETDKTIQGMEDGIFYSRGAN